MATTITSNFATIYDAKVKTAFQAESKLKGMTRMEMIEGNKHSFPIIEAGKSNVSVPGALREYGENNDSNAEAVIVDYESPYLIPKEHAAKVKYNPKDEYSQKAAKAIGRRCDQVIIDAIDTGAHSLLSIGADFGADDPTQLSLAKFARATAILNACSVPMEGRKMAIPASALEQLHQLEQFTNKDYEAYNVLKTGGIANWFGFDMVLISEFGDLDGLPADSTITDGKRVRSCLFWHTDAVGLAVNQNITSDIDWIPERQSFQALSSYGAGAVVIDIKGAGKLDYLEDVLEIPEFSAAKNLT